MFSSSPQMSDWLIKIRRQFHQNPELSFKEHATTAAIETILKQLNVDVQTFDNVTGAVGVLNGAKDGPTIGLRADIDALPIQELNNVSYKSKNPGVMHACGHDAHTAILLGTAKKIAASGLMSRVKGNVKLFFQPAEELGSGAKALIDRGALENPYVDRVIAVHVAPELPVGQMGVFRGKGMASANRFELVVTGKGAHGAKPEEGADPIVAASDFVMAIQSIVSRNISPREPAVVTIGKFKSGSAANIIPHTAYIEGSIRALTEDVRRLLTKRLQEIATGIAQTYQVTCDFTMFEGIPCLHNDKQVAEELYQVSETVLGRENVKIMEPVMGSEDFALFTNARPGAMFRLGCSNPDKGLVNGLHSPHFDLDERALEIGVEIFYAAVQRFFKINS